LGVILLKIYFAEKFLSKIFLINTRLSGDKHSRLSKYKGELKREA